MIMRYAIYVDDNCNEGFYEVERFDNLLTAQKKLHELREDNHYEDYWLVIIIDE